MLEPDFKPPTAAETHQTLLEFYGQPHWRQPLPALDELISTILSQNTNDTNRDRAFNTLRQRLPTWESVRDADVQEVIEAIRTAGLANQKGVRIQNILKEISRANGRLDLEFLGSLPTEEARQCLLQFKGVGPKTAAIVLLFSLNKPAFPVDTHIYRVCTRLGIIPAKMSAEQAHTHLEKMFPTQTYKTAHLNIIRLGREICHPRNPKCSICPLQTSCTYFQLNQPDLNK